MTLTKRVVRRVMELSSNRHTVETIMEVTKLNRRTIIRLQTDPTYYASYKRGLDQSVFPTHLYPEVEPTDETEYRRCPECGAKAILHPEAGICHGCAVAVFRDYGASGLARVLEDRRKKTC